MTFFVYSFLLLLTFLNIPYLFAIFGAFDRFIESWLFISYPFFLILGFWQFNYSNNFTKIFSLKNGQKFVVSIGLVIAMFVVSLLVSFLNPLYQEGGGGHPAISLGLIILLGSPIWLGLNILGTTLGFFWNRNKLKNQRADEFTGN